jgi:hypothetical protein
VVAEGAHLRPGWTEEEDKQLTVLVERHCSKGGVPNRRIIAAKIGKGRGEEACKKHPS